MLEDGLLERFPFEEVYGLHNWPGLAVGRLATRVGPLMAAEDIFEIVVKGAGAHAARPHQSKDALVTACAIVTALQTIVSRTLDPGETAVVSATELLTDGTRNVLPATARIRGDCRSFSPEVSRAIEEAMRRIAEGVAAAHGCAAESATRASSCRSSTTPRPRGPRSRRRGPCSGTTGSIRTVRPITASEDFARFLEHVPGCFVFLGNGVDSLPLHNAAFDFNDDALGYGARFHVEIARRRLPVSGRVYRRGMARDPAARLPVIAWQRPRREATAGGREVADDEREEYPGQDLNPERPR